MIDQIPKKRFFLKKMTKNLFSSRDIEKIRDGISEKVHFFLHGLTTFFVSLIIAFYYGWKLSLVVISYVPIAFVANTIIEKVGKINHHNMRGANFLFILSISLRHK